VSDVERNLKLINDGRMAHLASEHIGGLISEFKQRKVTELSQNFRAGKVDQVTLLTSVAGLCALEDLENDMRRKMIRSEKASDDLSKEQLK
jgi:hypothetical protein